MLSIIKEFLLYYYQVMSLMEDFMQNINKEISDQEKYYQHEYENAYTIFSYPPQILIKDSTLIIMSVWHQPPRSTMGNPPNINKSHKGGSPTDPNIATIKKNLSQTILLRKIRALLRLYPKVGHFQR